MKQTIEQVGEFHAAFAVPVKIVPTIPPSDRRELRLKLLREEVQELEDAFECGSLSDVLDALTDIQYVLDGTYLECGMQYVKAPAFDIIHRSNMSKLDSDGNPVIRSDGKVLKGENYVAPNLKPLFCEEYWRNR